MKIKILLYILGVVALGTLSIYAFAQYSIKKIAPEVKFSFTELDLKSEQSFISLINSPEFKHEIINKSIIGFGEATHGTSEFREAFVQMAKALILSKKINIIAYAERDFNESIKVNDYVLNKKEGQNVSTILPYSSSIEKEFIDWLANYNKDKTEGEKVWVLGLDIFNARYATFNTLEYCKENRIALNQDVQMFLSDLASLPMFYNVYKAKYSLNAQLQHVKYLQSLIKQEKASENNLQNRLLQHSIATLSKTLQFSDSQNHKFRDSAMFENIVWLKKQRNNASMLILGHNSHIEKMKGNILSEQNPRLGWLLEKNYKEDYFAIATEVSEGQYRSGTSGKIFNIPESSNKIGNIIGKCVRENLGLLYLRKSQKVHEYFNKDHYITYGVLDSDMPTYPKHLNFSDAFDAVLWTRTSTPLIISSLDSYTFFFSNNLNETLKRTNYLDVSFDSKIAFQRDTLLNNEPSFGIVFFQKRKAISFQLHPIVNPNSSFKLEIPSLADSIVVFISGESADSVRLNNLTINQSKIELKKINFDGANYQKQIHGPYDVSIFLKPKSPDLKTKSK